MILRGFASRWTKRRRRKRGPWRQSKGASFEKARGHRTEPYVAITREKECAECKVNGDTGFEDEEEEEGEGRNELNARSTEKE